MAAIYVSIDIEATGPAPELYSMLSLGAFAYDSQGNELGRWTANLEELEGAGWHPDTKAWWEEHLEMLAVTRQDVQPVASAMETFALWVETLGKRPIAVGWPILYDGGYVNWYLWRFAHRNPLGFAGVDLRSLAQGLTYSRGYYDLREAQIKALESEVNRSGLVEHNALDDAIEQGRLHMALLRLTKGGLAAAARKAGYKLQNRPPLDPHGDSIPV